MAKDKLNLFFHEEIDEKSNLTQFYNYILETAKEMQPLIGEVPDKYPHYKELVDKTINSLTGIISGKKEDKNFLLHLTRHSSGGISFDYHFTDNYRVYKCSYTYRLHKGEITNFTLDIHLLIIKPFKVPPKKQTYIEYNDDTGEYVFTLFENETIEDKHLQEVFTKYIYLIKDMTLPFVDKL
jgi:hypothetical protein|nr:MAG TPA: hypothetical protein [Bacteriophage sp.]